MWLGVELAIFERHMTLMNPRYIGLYSTTHNKTTKTEAESSGLWDVGKGQCVMVS